MKRLDPVYFSTRPWAKRLASNLARLDSSHGAAPFVDGHLHVIRQLLTHEETGPRMVINIGADALLRFLSTGDYKNIYEKPVVGGERRTPTKERLRVDEMLGFGARAGNYYFGAVALGGAGVRFYGEYCMVIKPTRIPSSTRLLDRDSYDLLLPPLAGQGVTRTKRVVAALRGEWGRDLVDMLVMKMMPLLPSTNHVMTSGNVASLVMSDQEFVEVHLADKVLIADLQEVRQLPEEAAIEASILNRRRARQSPTLVELRWVGQRRRVATRLGEKGVSYRLTTLHGKGYQWA